MKQREQKIINRLKEKVSGRKTKQAPDTASDAPKSSHRAAIRPDCRLFIMSVMGIFVLAVFGWGICQLIKNINTAGQMMTYAELQSIKKIEDNSQNAGKTLDVEALITKVLDKVAFEAELNKLDDSVAEGMIETTEGTKLQVYVGNGTYADELIVMTAKNESDARKNQENVKVHLSETKEEFQDYIPEEAKKIEEAVSIRCGCYVIVCVTSDYEKAEEIINAFIQD